MFSPGISNADPHSASTHTPLHRVKKGSVDKKVDHRGSQTNDVGRFERDGASSLESASTPRLPNFLQAVKQKLSIVSSDEGMDIDCSGEQ
jgi:hypothetical protein